MLVCSVQQVGRSAAQLLPAPVMSGEPCVQCSTALRHDWVRQHQWSRNHSGRQLHFSSESRAVRSPARMVAAGKCALHAPRRLRPLHPLDLHGFALAACSSLTRDAWPSQPAGCRSVCSSNTQQLQSPSASHATARGPNIINQLMRPSRYESFCPSRRIRAPRLLPLHRRWPWLPPFPIYFPI